MSLDEHMVCYFFEKNKTRQKTEAALISFLASLRYYVDLWFRARQYAQFIGFMKEDSSFK